MKCPYYQGVCSLNEEYVCYALSEPESCDIYKEHINKLINEIKAKVDNKKPISYVRYDGYIQ